MFVFQLVFHHIHHLLPLRRRLLSNGKFQINMCACESFKGHGGSPWSRCVHTHQYYWRWNIVGDKHSKALKCAGQFFLRLVAKKHKNIQMKYFWSIQDLNKYLVLRMIHTRFSIKLIVSWCTVQQFTNKFIVIANPSNETHVYRNGPAFRQSKHCRIC